MNLTSQQKKAIEQIQGPCIILAGAGTGKTFTIVEKIKYLIQKKNYPAGKIVCITFSNEACSSLQNRVGKVLPENSKTPIIKTFHALSADLLREHGQKIGINSKFKILTPDEAKIILHKNFKIPAQNCHQYINSIGIAKDLEISLSDLENYLAKKLENYKDVEIEKRLETLKFEIQTLYLKKGKDKSELSEEITHLKKIIKLKKFLSAWKAYEKIKEKNNFQDYSDLNKNALTLLKKNSEISLNYSYIIIDEFQDTNKIQLEILFGLAPHRNITAVGDINQSIYRFRGAYHKNLDEFRQHFEIPSENILTLDESYRSSDKILRNAHKIILNNYPNEKDCFEVFNKHKREGEKIQVFELKNAREEARKVVNIVKEKISEGTPMKEICVMFRNHQHSRITKKLLETENINYYSVSKSSLLEQKSIKNLIDYLTIINKLKNKEKSGEQSWWNLVYNLGLPEEDLIKIGKFIKENNKSECLSLKLLNDLQQLDLSEDGKNRIKLFMEKIKIMLPFASKPILETIKGIFQSTGQITDFESPMEKEIILNFNKFLEIAESQNKLYEPDLSSFLHHIEILKSLDINIEPTKIESEGVRLMTLHSTKGLEYETVIITNMAQKRFPSEKTNSNPLLPLELFPEFKQIKEQDLEYFLSEIERKHQLFEERRLCYVAFTRAKNNLILTFAESYNNRKHFPSQFLNEINFRKNPDISFIQDFEETYTEPKLEIKPTQHVKIKEFRFSPSSLLLFSECQKKFEYKYIYNMPEDKPENWDAIRLGSFIHPILEIGVKNNFKSLKEFLDLSVELNSKEDWQSVDLNEAQQIIKVFFERNRNKYNEKSKTEQILFAEIEGIKFVGFADRIDTNSEGLEIIDYKTGSSAVPPKNRNWQLGFYALAAAKFGKVKKLTLEMLKQEKPLEFKVDENGNASAVFSNRMEFNINEVKSELVNEAKKALTAIKSGFKSCPIEKNCKFCGEYLSS